MAPKKGISALITVVLLIVFTVAISTLIIAWMIDYTKTTTDAATESATGEKGITYCANSIVEISNVDLKNTAVAANNSVTSGTVNYFNLTSIAGTPTITFTGRSGSSGVNGLSGWWHFDDDALDSTANDNDGTVTGAAWNATGKFSSALQFDGDDFVTVPDDNILDMTDAITLSAWVSPSSGGVYSEWAYKKPVYIQDTRDNWWNTSWTKRKAITINKSMVNGTQTNFPMMIHINQLTNVNENGTDIRMTDANGNQLPREIEWYNQSTGNLTLFFAGNISNETDTMFYMYYGNPSAAEPAADSTYGSENVWDNNYVGVWHMNNDPNGDVANSIKDSTSYENHGTPTGSMTSADFADSDYGKGIDFDASNDYIRVPDSGQELDIIDYYTIESIAVPYTSTGTFVGGIYDISGANKQYGIFDKTTQVSFLASQPGVKDGSTVYVYTGKHYTAGTFDTDANILRLIVNGAFRDSDTLNTVASPNWDLLIGARHSGSNAATTSFFNGTIEEFRVSKIVRSDNWLITTQNNNANPAATGTNAFYSSFGDEDTYLTDYQIKIDSINTTLLYDSGKIQQYCNDTRFTWLNQTSGAEEVIDFWTENCDTTGGNSTFWVEVPEIYAGASDNTVYMYYGNPSAANQSDMSAVFVTATGGAITYFGAYTIHTFTNDGTFTISGAFNVEVLVVGGGGGAGSTPYYAGGGGGAGGYIYNPFFAVTSQAYPVTVGIGGGVEVNGGNSSFSTITSVGGGAGGTGRAQTNCVTGGTGKNGGSGGGGGAAGCWDCCTNGGPGGTGVIGQGYNGGSGGPGGLCTFGGGGGAGGPGGNGVSGAHGAAGIGLTNSINGSSVTYATGGGHNTLAPANSGNGGAGDGSVGASGIVIVRYSNRSIVSPEPTILSVDAEIANGISKGNACAINANATHAFARINDQIITTTISAGWNHIALTYDKDAGGTEELKIYINSVEMETADYSTAINTNADDFVVGNSFIGTIDEVRIYNRALLPAEISSTYNTADLDANTTNPRASFNGNPTINYSGTLADGTSTTITVDAGNFTVGENNITIYTDSGVVDYSVGMLSLSALVSNTGMNNVTVKQVVAFRDDGTYCVLKNDSTTFDVGGMFSVSGCGMECLEFLALKAFTDCTGVQGIFSGTPQGC